MATASDPSDEGWVRLYEEPGEPMIVQEVIGQYGPLDRFGTLSTTMVVGKEGSADPELVGLMIHPTLEGVALSAVRGTPAGELPMEELTEKLRWLGWRWATEEEIRALAGYLVPGLDGAPRPADGSARAAALGDLT